MVASVASFCLFAWSFVPDPVTAEQAKASARRWASEVGLAADVVSCRKSGESSWLYECLVEGRSDDTPIEQPLICGRSGCEEGSRAGGAW
jgi:hypothetical protein